MQSEPKFELAQIKDKQLLLGMQISRSISLDIPAYGKTPVFDPIEIDCTMTKEQVIEALKKSFQKEVKTREFEM